MGKRGTPPLDPDEVIGILEALGFRFDRQKGSHAQYKRPATKDRSAAVVTVDMHHRSFDDELMKNMIRQSTFNRNEFYD